MPCKHVITADVKAELEALTEANDGLLKPEHVVEAARERGTALHGYMASQGLWNKNTAQEYALSMAARLLIMRVKVKLLDEQGNPRTTRAFVSLLADREEGRGYRRVLDVAHSDNAREALLETAKREAASFARKYRELTELAPVLAGIDELLAE